MVRLLGAFCLLLFPFATVFASPVTADGLRCERLIDPLGVDVLAPRLSWLLHSRRRGEVQTAYRVIVSTSPKDLASGRGDLWDSGKRVSAQSVLVEYAGKRLTSRQQCFWKVRVWSRDGRSSEWSPVAHWEMGLLGQRDWLGRWIGLEGGDGPNRRLPAPMLRREFAARPGIRRARAYVCGLGLFELHVNGRKVGDHVLDPALSEYGKRVYYVAFDVTDRLKSGRNAIGVILGNGRYYAPRLSEPIATRGFGYPKALVQVDIDYADGSRARVVSDERWRVSTDGPIRANNEYDGEEYDARQELRGWCVAGFDDSAWKAAQLVPGPTGVLRSQMSPPIRVIETLRPIAVRSPRPGSWVFDMGQNMVGWCRLAVSGPRGAVVTLRHAETLKADQTLDVANLRSARATDTYTLAGSGTEVLEPRFTYHGFRYVEVTGLPTAPTTGTLAGRVVHDDLDSAGSFNCSNELVNRIWRNVRWGVRGNYRSIPTDCPQRDERQGWLGDRSAESRGESYLFDGCTFYERWMDDIRDVQRADGSIPDVSPAYWSLYSDDVTWPSTFVIIPGMLYDQYGDSRAIRENYPAIKRWLDYMRRYLSNDLMPRDSYGDWCVPPESARLIHTQDPARRTDGTLIATAYYWYDLRLAARYARLLRYSPDAVEFEALAERIKEAFNKRYFKPASNLYDNGTQTSSLLPLALGLVPVGREEGVFAALKSRIQQGGRPQIGTGLIGCQWLMHTLTDRGGAGVAWSVATREDYPSWGYMVRRGATTIWELWNGDTADPAMNSGNHVMLVGDLLAWLYERVAGIAPDPAQPGFRHIRMRPLIVPALTAARATHLSPYGMIVSAWRRQDRAFVWDVEVPPNTSATLWIPSASAALVKEGDRRAASASGLRVLRTDQSTAVVEVGSGRYHFVSALEP